MTTLKCSELKLLLLLKLYFVNEELERRGGRACKSTHFAVMEPCSEGLSLRGHCYHHHYDHYYYIRRVVAITSSSLMLSNLVREVGRVDECRNAIQDY